MWRNLNIINVQVSFLLETYRNPVRRGDLGIGSNRKKVVPESGTQRESENRQQSEESCTGIRYEERNRERATIGSKLYRNPICREGLGTGSDWKRVVPESGTQERILFWCVLWCDWKSSEYIWLYRKHMLYWIKEQPPTRGWPIIKKHRKCHPKPVKVYEGGFSMLKALLTERKNECQQC